MRSAIRCEQLFKRYDSGKDAVDAVNGLDLTVSVGECFGLLGPNGAGKTTTIEIFEGLLEPTSGLVEVLDERWTRGTAQALRQRIGITLQETRLQEKLTVRETLRLFRSFYRRGIDAEQALGLVGLEEKAASRVGKLSGGQLQRLAVATALVGDPALIFLDEPTTGLDPQARRQLWAVITDLKSAGRTVLLTTHYMDEAEKLCDRVAIVDHGRVIALGTPRQLIAQMGGEHVIEFGLAKEHDVAIEPADFADLPSVRKVVRETHGYLLTVGEPHRAIPALLQHLDGRGLELTALTTRHANLEDVFVNLTGRHLTDDTD